MNFHKYKAKKTIVDNIVFDSKKEANDFIDFRTQLDAGLIKKLEIQVPVNIIINDFKICTLKVDFKITNNDDTVQYFDSKGICTPVYKLKKKLVYALYGIEIIELYQNKHKKQTKLPKRIK